MKNIISTKEFTKSEAEKILTRSAMMEKSLKKGNTKQILRDKIIACIFFEPSTRTRLSFETAALKLGAQVISSENATQDFSSYKGESIEDTTRMLCCYANLIVMRHPKEGTLEAAAQVATKPLINAGDGANQHPSQAFIDLYTIKKEIGRLDNINIAFVGDILNSRTLRSLVPLLILYPKNTFYFISPKELVLSAEYRKYLTDKNVNFKETNDLESILPKVDVLYMTRVQKERFSNIKDYEKVKDSFLLKPEHLKKLNKKAIIIHPLPRVNEIDKKIDQDPRAAYFRQAQNGLYVRMALLCYTLEL